MNTKLTLSIDETVIRDAKIFAKKKNLSVSSLVENYLQSITQAEKSVTTDGDITPVVKSLSGVISLPDDFDYKADYREHLIQKYSDE